MDERAFPQDERPENSTEQEYVSGELLEEDIAPEDDDMAGERSERSNPYDMAIMVDEETGEQWCTIKYAAKLTGLSYSTIRRYTKDGRLQFRTEDSPFGKVNYVNMNDIKNYKAAYDLDKAKRGVRASDYQFEMTSFIRTAFAPSVSELHTSLEDIRSTQSELISRIDLESESRRAQLDSIIAQSDALTEKIGELSRVIEMQEAAINELKASAEKKGFWSKLFGK